MRFPRIIVQILAALASNCAFLLGQPLPGAIYQGALKRGCLPGLNCYACPYAIGACPLGSLQYFLAWGRYHFSVYLAGFFLLLGGLLGRFICGWLCPFGLIQDILHRIPSPKFNLPRKVGLLRWAWLLGLVVLVPLILKKPGFCAWVCPAGTLEGGIPLPTFDPGLRQLIGGIFFLKLGILAVFLLGSICVYRPFCQAACPLGLIYGFFNRISVLTISLDRKDCRSCGLCRQACPVNLDPQAGEFERGECLRCLRCVRACPTSCLRFGARARPPGD